MADKYISQITPLGSSTTYKLKAYLLKNGRTFKVKLDSTNASTAFDGSANITDIGVSGILETVNGGTGNDSFTKNTLIYANTATKLASYTSTRGGTKKLWYLNAGVPTDSTETVGATDKPVFLSSGTITESTSNIGSEIIPIYMVSGQIKASTSTVGSGEWPVYLNSGTIAKTTYYLKSNIEDGSASQLAYYSAARTIDYTPKIYYINSLASIAEEPINMQGLRIVGGAVGNDSSSKKTTISGTTGLLSYGDGGPQIQFSTSEKLDDRTTSGAQSGALIFTDHNAAATGASWHFVSNQSDWNVISKRFHARTGISIGTSLPNTSYTLYTRGIANFNIADDNAYGIGGHRLNAIFEGTNHASILIATPTNNHAYGIAVNQNGNMYIGYRNTGSYTSYTGDKYLLILNSTQLYPNTDLEMNLGLSNKRWKDIYGGNFTYNGTIYFGDGLSTSKPILAYSTTYPYFGIYYWNESTDVIAIDGHGKSNSKTEADLAINALGAGIISTRNRYIPHTGNDTGTVGNATRPVYVNAGTITQGTYELKATVNSGTAKQVAYYSAASAISGTSILTIESNHINVTVNSNTVAIGSQNANYTHIYNSADIPFIFNKSILTVEGNLGNATYPWNDIYLGKGTTRHIYFVGSKATTSMIRFLNETSTTYGNGISIGGGGLTIIGGGESASSFGTGSWTAETEETVVLSDNNIWLEAGANTIANRIGFQIDKTGNLIPVKAEALNNNAQNIGATNAKLANIYATTFHGTVNGNVYEDMLLWGGHALGTNSWSPIDTVLNDYTRGNGFAGLPAANITVEHSTNAGSSWTTTSVSDLVKCNLVTNDQSMVRIVASGNVPNNANPQLRITIKCSGSTYFQLKKIHILISTNGSSGCKVTIKGSLNSAPTTFNQIICNDVTVTGWSGWNSITCDTVVGANDSQIHSLQFTFTQTGVSSSYVAQGLRVCNISGYGYMKHTAPSQLAKQSHAYTIDGNDNVTFPNTGSVIISKTQDASGTADNKPALIVGGLSTDSHIEIDSNEILAKSNGTTPTTLYLQDTTGTVSVAGSGGLIVSSLTASQAVSTDANKKLISSNLTTADPSASGSGITYIASISQSAIGKITATKSTVRNASTSQTGVLQFTAANTNTQLNTLTTGSSTPVDADYYISQYVGGGTTTTTYHRRPMSALWDYIKGHIIDDLYWANIKVQGSSKTDTIPTFKTIYFGSVDPTTNGRGILAFSSTYPNYGLWYFNDSTDVITLDGHGKANSKTEADLAINALGAGIISTRNRYIPHTGNTTGTVGTATRPVYVNAGAITQGSYELKATVNTGTANRAAYYSGTNTIEDAGSIYMTASRLGVNATTYQHTLGGTSSTSDFTFSVLGNGFIRDTIYTNTELRVYRTATGNAWRIFDDTVAVGSFNISAQGTASQSGLSYITIGNTLSATTKGNAKGRLYLGKQGAAWHVILGENNNATNSWHYLPDATGWVVTAGDGTSTGAGSANVPVYVSTSGIATSVSANSVLTNLASTTAASTYAASPRPGVTGTLPVGHGGTGNTSYTANRLIYSESASKLSAHGSLIISTETTYASRTITPLLRVNGILMANTQIESAAYFMNNGTGTSGSHGYYLYRNNASYARLFVTTVGTVATADAAGTAGIASLYLGNGTAQPAAGATTAGANNAYGRILLYGTGTTYTILRSNPNGSRTSYLPHAAADNYLVCKTTTAAVGGTGTPVYVDANGAITACTAYSSATVNIANKLKTTQATNATKMFILGQSAAGAGQDTYIATAYSSGSANKTGIYFQGSTGVLMGAAWNDYAEFRQSKENKIIEPGRVVYENGDDTLSMSNERLMRGCSIVSDTYGFGIGESEEAQLPIAVSGRVLAYPYENKEEFKNHIGWPVCSGPNGTVSIMTEEEEMKYPSRIIGIISAVPDYEVWHGGADVIVDGRIWIKVR